MILLHTSDESGSVFIRTDQLDGETDWKLRKAVAPTQRIIDQKILIEQSDWRVQCEAPHMDIYKFEGVFEYVESTQLAADPLNLENTLWAGTVLASGNAIGLVTYTGRETRSVLNSRMPTSKFGITDEELNRLTILIFLLMFGVAIFLMCMNGFRINSHVILLRNILLLSWVIPISLRVNLDMAKIYYCWLINRD